MNRAAQSKQNETLPAGRALSGQKQERSACYRARLSKRKRPQNVGVLQFTHYSINFKTHLLPKCLLTLAIHAAMRMRSVENA